jgi:hypothetical protein
MPRILRTDGKEYHIAFLLLSAVTRKKKNRVRAKKILYSVFPIENQLTFEGHFYTGS